MHVRLTLVLGLALLFGSPALAEPPVTSPESPSPAKRVTALWREAKQQAEQVRERDPAQKLSEPLRMLLAVERDTPLAPGVGWYDPGRTALDWAWLARRCDANRDACVSRKELSLPAELFDRLDRDRDGAVTAEELDLSHGSKWAVQDALTLRMFRLMDASGNGRVTAEEMRAAFDRLARGKEHLTVEDLQAALAGERGRGKRVSKEKWIECLVAGDLGSPFDGPRPGQAAPDFTLPTQDGKRTVTLSEFRGKRPVVLIFGSFTWGPFRAQFGALEALYRRHADRAAFVAVYVREAHPEDGAATPNNAAAGIVVRQPKTDRERTQVAGTCSAALNITMPLVVDTLDDRVGHAYSAMPDRLYLIDREGNVAYQGGRGPFGFRPTELEQALILLSVTEQSSEKVKP